MKIAIVGYGKMGKIIEEIAVNRGHMVVSKLKETPTSKNLNHPDVVIEFSKPEAAFTNVSNCLELGIPVVCGTTGWLQDKPAADILAVEKQTGFLYGSNFSLGVNLFFTLNKKLAKMMSKYPQYKTQLEEIHHKEKKDAPSGTAITIAEGILENSDFKNWKKGETEGDQLGIISVREGDASGIHEVTYRSLEDEIEIKHTAFSRAGFALGAVMAAEWLPGKKGVFSMADVLDL